MDTTSSLKATAYSSTYKPVLHTGIRLIDSRDFAYDRDTLDWLLDQGIDINQTDSQRLDEGFNLARGETDNSLHLLNNVAAAGDIGLFDHLVSRGADPSLSTALHAASRYKDPDMCRAMIRHPLEKHNMDVHSNNDDFREFFHDAHDRGSPLCLAVIHQTLAAVHELLQQGASPNDPHSRPISYAVKNSGFLPALEPLLRAGADPAKSLKQAVHYRNLDAVKICLVHGADPAPELYIAIEREEERMRDAVEDAAYVESLPVPDRGRAMREQMANERKNKAMIALLSGEEDSDDAVDIAHLR